MKRIAIVKTGWCEYYDGDPVTGNHKFIQDQGFGHEIYNMRPWKGKFYVYLPPIGNSYVAPSPDGDDDDWTVVVVAPKGGTSPLVVVGWYEEARFIKSYSPRPDMGSDDSRAVDPLGEMYSYTMVAKRAFLVPPEARSLTLPRNVLGRSPIFYCRGNATSTKNKNRDVMATFVERFVVDGLKSSKSAVTVPAKGTQGSQGGGFATAAHRAEVEKISMKFSIKYYESRGYQVKDVSALRGLGYDLLATKQSESLYVEVKGTAGKEEGFFITRNEDHASYKSEWRLFIVSNILSKPKVTIRDGKQYRRDFRKDPTQFQCYRRG